ncbi:glutamate receptor ionotropic, delta-2-like [Branchiostoma floridae]|uniref:Glutamate receptor ionotropic, delta-2-like n=1 Tax=Branchiostoma floridae TaxID=7739 RepID=A0A9J7HGV1_BRAFL|nr:glutamate receptor ionotropic, delta-2-like [Branchiostoma floridae]
MEAGTLQSLGVRHAGTFLLFSYLMWGTHETAEATVRRIRIGAIFDAQGSDEEVAFQAGVHDVNRKRQLFDHTQAAIETKVTYLGNLGPYAAAFQVCQLLQTDVVAILSHVTCQETATLTSLTSELRIPHLTTNKCPDVDLGDFVLSATPDPANVDLALAAYMEDNKWEQIVIFYDKDTNFNRIQTILGTSPENKMAMTIFRVPPVPRTDYDGNIFRLLSRIEADGVKLSNVLILCDGPNTLQLLAQAFVSGPVREGSFWLIGNPEVSDDDIKNTIGTARGVITTISHVLDLSDAARDLISTLPAKITRDFIQNGGKTVIPYSKVFFKTSRTWKGSLGRVAFGPFGHNSRAGYKFLSLKTVNKTAKFVPTGTWSERAGLNMTQRMDWPDIQGVTLRVVTVEDIPFVFEQVRSSGVEYDGFSIDVIKELSKTLNFSFVVYGVADQKYGAPRADGTWNGMIGDVVNKVSMTSV